MERTEPKRVTIKVSNATCMENIMKEHVGRGGCSTLGHYGIKPDGMIQLGEILPHLDFSFTPPSVETIKVLFLRAPTVFSWRSLQHLIAYLKRVYPSIAEVTTTDEGIKEEVEEHYGRLTEEGTVS